MAAVDHAVTIDRMHHVIGLQAHPAIHPADQQIADFPAFGSEHQHLRFPGGPAGGVEHDR